jgi:hypothetical protein
VSKDTTPTLKTIELSVFMLGIHIRDARRRVRDAPLKQRLADANKQNYVTLGHMRKAVLRSLELKSLVRERHRKA